MSNSTTKINKEQVIQSVKDYPAAKVKLAITDIDGVLRGKVIHRDKFLSMFIPPKKGGRGVFGFCDVVFGWDPSDTLYDNVDFTGWHTGYPDAQAKIDLSTFRNIPWDNDVPFFLADFIDDDGNSLQVCSRSLLKKIKQQAIDAGFSPVFSVEFEWFNFKETPWELYDKDFKNIRPLTPGMFGYSILRSSYNSQPHPPSPSPQVERGQGGEVDYIFEPSRKQIMNALIPYSLRIRFYKALLESNVAEHGARMTAMDQATDNAEEILRDLRLTYNRTRQASITKEILEIVGGAEALEGGS